MAEVLRDDRSEPLTSSTGPLTNSTDEARELMDVNMSLLSTSSGGGNQSGRINNASNPNDNGNPQQQDQRRVSSSSTDTTNSSTKKKSFSVTLWIVFTIFVTFRASDRIFLKDIQNGLQRSSYNLIWANVIWPVLIQLMTAIMIACYVTYRRMQGDLTYDWKFFLPGNVKASSLGAVPMMQLALFSMGDQLNAAISAPPSPFVTLPIQSVMTNMVIVYTAIIAFWWLGTRYRQVHLIGILLIVIAIMVQFGPAVTNNDCSEEGLSKGLCFSSYKNTQGEWVELTTAAMICWYLLFGISFVPASFGNVYKQKVYA